MDVLIPMEAPRRFSMIGGVKKTHIVVKNELYARHELVSRHQNPTESIEDFLSALKMLSRKCHFKAVSAKRRREEAIRDAFINGIASTFIRQSLLEHDTLDLQATFDQARALQLSESRFESSAMLCGVDAWAAGTSADGGQGQQPGKETADAGQGPQPGKETADAGQEPQPGKKTADDGQGPQLGKETAGAGLQLGRETADAGRGPQPGRRIPMLWRPWHIDSPSSQSSREALHDIEMDVSPHRTNVQIGEPEIKTERQEDSNWDVLATRGEDVPASITVIEELEIKTESREDSNLDAITTRGEDVAGSMPDDMTNGESEEGDMDNCRQHEVLNEQFEDDVTLYEQQHVMQKGSEEESAPRPEQQDVSREESEQGHRLQCDQPDPPETDDDEEAKAIIDVGHGAEIRMEINETEVDMTEFPQDDMTNGESEKGDMDNCRQHEVLNEQFEDDVAVYEQQHVVQKGSEEESAARPEQQDVSREEAEQGHRLQCDQPDPGDTDDEEETKAIIDVGLGAEIKMEINETEVDMTDLPQDASQVVQCEHCDYRCIGDDILARHVRRRHSQVGRAQKYKCRLCVYSTNNPGNLKLHQVTHTGERGFACEECGKAFTTRGALTRHTKGVHDEIRSHRCEICGKAFKHGHYLSEHMRAHTGTVVAECGICGKQFSGRGKYTTHMKWRHAGAAEAYECHVCPARFPYLYALKNHIRRHTEGRQHACQYCGQMFWDSVTLKNHVIGIHTHDYKNWCELCGKGFRRPCELRKHSDKCKLSHEEIRAACYNVFHS